jgi:hypothetical protein
MSMRMWRSQWPALLLAMMAIVTGACSPRNLLISQVGRIIDAGQPAYERETDLYLLSHSFPSHFKLLEALSVSDPQNTELLVLIARLYAGYAFTILETEGEALRYGQPPAVGLGLSRESLEKEMTHCFQTGAEFALKALACKYPDIRDHLSQARSAVTFFDTLQQEDVPALFWYGFNLAGAVLHNLQSISAMSQAYQVESAMRRVIALNPAYYHSSAHLVLLVYYASRSPMMGGNPELAQWHYNQHLLLIPQPMRLRELYWTRYYRVQLQQRTDFTRVLTELSAEVPQESRFPLLDSVAAKRAAVYLKSVEHFFDD